MKLRNWSESAFVYTGRDLALLQQQTDYVNADLKTFQTKDLLVYCLDHGGIHYISGNFPDDETPSMTKERFWPTCHPEFEAIIVDATGCVRQTFKAPVTAAEIDAFLVYKSREDQQTS